ncbi:MAG: polysaccharide pyruvyl transferase family protein [Muribaculaceae bacterium]|nr:polysaccharide pyruvyl transferase family protein [Muribaculaceae bacterium]
MNIAIITQPLGHNIGGMLQNWALQLTLKELGHQPVTLNYLNERKPGLKDMLRLHARNVRTLIRRMRGQFDRYKRVSDLQASPDNMAFIKREINVTEALAHYRPLDNIDAYIVGSDQVWRPRYNKQTLYDQFLQFTGDLPVRRIAYAASFGTDRWEMTDEQTAVCRRLASRFDAVSVREDSAVELCRTHLGCEPAVVLDPTLLPPASAYDTIISRKHDSDYTATYFLEADTAKHRIAVESAQRLDCKLVDLNPYRTTPEDWLGRIRDSRFVVTDSFHGTVFAIIFHRDFIVVPNNKRGNGRLHSLLSLLRLQDRLVAGSDELNDIMFRKIDWEKTDRILDSMRAKSVTFIKDALS